MGVEGLEARGDRLLVQLTRFARALHRVGLPVAPDKILHAVRAVMVVGIDRRDDFYSTLHAVFVNRPDQRDLFDQLFYLFWRDPLALERVSAGASYAGQDSVRLSRRVLDALLADRPPQSTQDATRREIDARLSWSADERFRTKDFEAMSAEELAEAERAVRDMPAPASAFPSRRFRADRRGDRIDMRRTIRAVLRTGPGTIPLVWRRRRKQHPPLVMLCDISGSMATYTRVFLNFAHAMTHCQPRVSTFLFATRLSNITRRLRERDTDRALERVGRFVEDWEGGTRIGSCLHEFNYAWSRRVLAQNATVILITDGLDREVGENLVGEMERLRKSCKRLIWLNPLLRYDAFQPLALGVKAILPFADEFRSIHNLQKVGELSEALTH
jgi:uncharacterized protein with von Willebrand factor type A (vWA) domain